MKKKEMTLEARLEAIKNFYNKLDDMLGALPDIIPDEILSRVKKAIFEDEDLNRIMQGLDQSRPPRFLVVGRTGIGKSSLINAICGLYVAGVSAVRVGTRGTERYSCMDGDRTLMEILDTRGIGEPAPLEEETTEGVLVKKGKTAEEVLQEDIITFKPDAILFVLRCKRDRIEEDIKYVKDLRKNYWNKVGVEVPIIVILNQADDVEPAQYKEPSEYNKRKLDNIQLAVEEMERNFRESKFIVSDIIPVSSLIDWGYSSEEVKNMTPIEKQNMQMELDARWNIEKLLDSLEENLDVDASMGLMMAAGLNKAVERVAMKFTTIFAGVAAGIASLPIPFADIVTLTLLQAILVMFIAYLAGEEINIEGAKKFVISLFGIGAGANLFKLTARQLSKLIPVAGMAINAGIAYSGTYSVGKMAAQYYIYGVSMGKLKKNLEKNYKEAEKVMA